MTSFERVMMALEGKKPDRIPVFPLIRDWAILQAGFKVSDVLYDVPKFVCAQFYCVKKYGYDAVRDFGATNQESEAMGCKLKVSEDSSPAVISNPIENYDEDLRKLRIPNPWATSRLPIILEGIKQLKLVFANKVPVVANLMAPFRNASMLRGFETILRDIHKCPGRVKELLEITTLCQIHYGIACAHAGADILFIADPTLSGDIVSRKVWEEFGLPYTKRMVEAVKRMGVKVAMHICGDTSDRLESLASTGVDALSLDHAVDLVYAKKILGDSVALIGNINPTDSIVFKSAKEVYKECRDLISAMGSSKFILSSGCAIPANAPPENIEAMVRAAADFQA